ncbi:hypothetical protein KKC88_03505 [Patescibacteria group bacterium]|nr:hypothetical protein [Patescibacteria group bacterium]MBU1673561.1 hypothetical protein [Patescibacteria group bacterium]MBU1963639.1 hypothetical protein [Patescibacteria group bacterium]
MDKKCFCNKKKIKLRLAKDFTENVIDILYCPDCLDQAGPETLVVNVLRDKNNIGLWGIRFNKIVLKDQDPEEYIDKYLYFAGVFIMQKCIFDFLPKDVKIRSPYRILGYKGDVPEGYENITGPDFLLMANGKPIKFPKKTRSGPLESYKKASGDF